MTGSPSSVLTMGLGSWGSPGLMLTLGYGITQPAVETGTPAPTWHAAPRPTTGRARSRPEVWRAGPRCGTMRPKR